MSQFSVLLQKEWRENVRNYKIFWIPVVFILFGIMEPVINYFLPQILDSVGGLPEGAVLEIPTPTPEQILVAVTGQYQFIGMLALILAYMGTVAGERKSGTATLLYVRPLSFSAYFLSKWLMASLIALLSLWLGLLAAYYYTLLLFDTVNFADFLRFAATYSVWVVLIVSIVLAASAALPNAGMAAAVSLGSVLLMQLVDGLIGAYWSVSPLKIPVYAASWLNGRIDLVDFWISIGLVAVVIALLLIAGIWASRLNASKAKV
ncbi:ABC transporter permease subunit [Planococcus salinus]|uniref:ABC transporter permease n=1 Tax=Planococcus salinus TaxID=1848460 RepID=A0A3M8P9E6_9BACL|nr:ABC transporter permease subunit [Planococcus salinus]RNF40298.1 ABC transporter permease [Planococcus salinus]